MSKKLETLGLIEVTSQRQADNGTICYHDPVTKCDYISYESGYVRRSYKTKAWLSGKEITNIYQLNPKRKVAGRWGAITERILINDHDSRVDLIARATINYRKTIDKNFLNKNILTEFEKTLLEGMNRRAMLIVKTEDFLQEQKISFNKEILYGLPDDTLRDLCENWNPENQKNRRKNIKSETLRPGNHTINGSLAKDKVSQLTFKDQLDIMSRILNDVAADYQFDINSPDYLGFLNCSPIDDNWPEIERYIMAVFLSRERAILDTMLEERGLDIEAGADLVEIIFIERR